MMKERKRAVNNIYWLVKLKCWQIGQNNCIDFLVLTFYMTIEKFTDAARRNCSCLHLVLADIRYQDLDWSYLSCYQRSQYLYLQGSRVEPQ